MSTSTIKSKNAVIQKKGTLTKAFVNDASVPYHYTGIFVNDLTTDNNIGIPQSSWFYIMHFAKDDSDGWAHQIFYELGGTGRIYHRISTGTSSWGSVIALHSNNMTTAPTNISSYTSTYYICPCNGYIRAECDGTTGSAVIAYVYGNIPTTGAFASIRLRNLELASSTYVERGMKIIVEAVIGANSKILFVPIT